MAPERDAFGNEIGDAPSGVAPTPAAPPPPARPLAPAAPPLTLEAPLVPEAPRAPTAPPTLALTHPPTPSNATLSLVIGLIGLFTFWFISPVAWWMGRRALHEIDASNGRLGGRGVAQWGRILGIVGTVLLVVVGGLAALGFILEATRH